MLVAGVVCLTVAAVFVALGARTLARPTVAGAAHRVLRAVAPTQLAAAVMLTAGGVVALSRHPSIGLVGLCVAGALATVAAGAWQGAAYVHASVPDGREPCRGSCAACTLPCR
ncbi:MAG: hypothetical protein ACM4D3_11430 [Candidatus Sericytochromatia bacterium]